MFAVFATPTTDSCKRILAITAMFQTETFEITHPLIAQALTEFADQLHSIENTELDNMDCHIIVGGDLNVDLSRAWVNTAMLASFCSNNDLFYALRHDKIPD
jgi:hypothetical protein